jgi:hypothetical protein
MSHEHTLYNLEQLEPIMRENPLVLRAVISMQSVQPGAHGKMGQPAVSHISTLQAGKFVAGPFPTSGLLGS